MGLRDRIRTLTKCHRGDSIESIITSINPILRGWFGYFRHAHRYTFSSVDGFVRRRLRAILRRQLHRPGQGRCFRDRSRWPNAFFANLGLFTMHEAHQLARQSQCGNNWLESPSRDNRTPGSEGVDGARGFLPLSAGPSAPFIPCRMSVGNMAKTGRR
ncbi:group II intron maturase-specific domain-containing protein [Cupriavidus basilensis]